MSQSPPKGLTERQAAARLRAEGPNALPDSQRRSAARILVEVLREPMFALLLGAAVLHGVLGDLADTVVLLVFACLAAGWLALMVTVG